MDLLLSIYLQITKFLPKGLQPKVVDEPLIEESEILDFSGLWKDITTYLHGFIPRLLLAIVLLYVGRFLIKQLIKLLMRMMEARQYEDTLKLFLKSVLRIVLHGMLILALLKLIGFNTASIITALGAVGLAVGLALQGSLSNFAGGVLILVFKPFKVGDVISTGELRGRVKEINVLYTVMITLDGRKIVLPNGNLSNNAVINFSSEDNRRVDIILYLDFKESPDKALNLIREVFIETPMILTDPAPETGVGAISDLGVKVDVYAWFPRDYYFKGLFDLNKRIKDKFDANGVLIAEYARR